VSTYGPALIATAGDEMQVTGSVVALEVSGLRYGFQVSVHDY
jgi:hypothetical protein